jgi:hypothetical protein
MWKKFVAKRRRRKVKKLIRNHASEIIVGVLMGLLTDVLTDFASAKLTRRYARLR